MNDAHIQLVHQCQDLSLPSLLLFYAETTINTFSVSQVEMQLTKLIYGTMYSTICIMKLVHGFGHSQTISFMVNIGINQVHLLTPDVAITTLNWYYVVTQQEEIILFHRDLFNLIDIYFHVDTKYKYQHQQSLLYQSKND